MIDPILIGVIGTVAGVLAAGAMTALTDTLRSRRERRQHNYELLRGKLEELCSVAEEVAQHYRDERAEIATFVQSTGPLESKETAPIPWARLRVLVNFYAPELKPTLDELMEQREPFGKALARIIFADNYKSVDLEGAKKKYDEAVVGLLRLAQQLQDEAASKFRRLPT